MKSLYQQLKNDDRFSTQIEAILKDGSCDIEPDFLGFTDTYRELAKIIPKNWTVIDLGCSYATQAYYFLKHKQYIEVDISDCVKLNTPNSIFYHETIKNFIDNHKELVAAPQTFAICNYVPPWYEGSDKFVKEAFRDCFVFYPQGPFI